MSLHTANFQTDPHFISHGPPDLHEHPSYMLNGPTPTSQDLPDIADRYSPKVKTQHPEQVSWASPEQDIDHGIVFPNPWARFRHSIREPAAEFLGTMILVIFGTGVNCQVALSGNPAVSTSPKGEYLSISFGWAVGVALGAWVSGGISGGHINPAVTIALAIFRGFPWKKVPFYIFAQVLGGFAGAGLVYTNYNKAIDLFEGGHNIRTVPGSASLFTTFAMDHLSDAQCFFSEVLGTALLLIVILAVTDKHNGCPPSGMVPVALFIAILGEGACLGMQTGYALNPARDIGPRLMCWAAGYGRQLWSYRYQYWLYTPTLGPIIGATLGAAIYDALIFTGPESIFNQPDSNALRRRRNAPTDTKVKILPSGEESV
ncbi:unnamed protein product [Rhizoctonia solani]|uniref:Uncharacterized protein n=1 Tax=Rhizoctonia solani TaxID=456999 RepID=A0A8H3HRU5_9AGAM|nr:unnamed protein product [Rhizoctonia solani]